MSKAVHQTTHSYRSLTTSFELVNDSVLVGFVANPARPTDRFTVELLVDGLVVMTAYADLNIQKVTKDVVGDGCHGFAFRVPQTIIENAVIAEARVANLGEAIGSPISLR